MYKTALYPIKKTIFIFNIFLRHLFYTIIFYIICILDRSKRSDLLFLNNKICRNHNLICLPSIFAIKKWLRCTKQYFFLTLISNLKEISFWFTYRTSFPNICILWKIEDSVRTLTQQPKTRRRLQLWKKFSYISLLSQIHISRIDFEHDVCIRNAHA